jgi:Uma2 family endonuclease
MATTKFWTVEEIEQLPDDEYRHMLLRGELYRMPPPKFLHGRMVLAIGAPLFQFLAEHGLGVVSDQSGFVLERDPDTLLGPDLAFVQSDRAPADENTYPLLAPDLVVDVASPAHTGPSIEEKTALSLAAGAPLVWIIDPVRRGVRVRRADGTDQWLFEQDELDGEEVLPGFRLPMARLFA